MSATSATPSEAQSTLKTRLETDRTAAMKARDELASATLRMALAAIRTEEVAGKAARTLNDDEILQVLARELKKRKEAAEMFAKGGRDELAERELAEAEVLERYLPKQLSDVELTELVAQAVSEAGPGAKMGAVMKASHAKVARRADGARVAAEVRRQLEA
ncbi:MAG: GatB/YqeY domain-containing protein [Corynebacteriales bacterium]|nr:GatB/YqeY domain-containing protein [Mycobacteriales bacterium]